jgi:uroporphyrinogen-III decarboxylase
MNSRERVLRAINHQEPDRVPVDLGGSIVTGIMAGALVRLRERLGLSHQGVKVYDQFQMLGEVAPDLVELFKVDLLPVEPEIITFGFRNRNFKPWTLFDGTPVLMPGDFDVVETAEGDWLVREGGDPDRPVVARMPKDGFYFDRIDVSGWNQEYVPPPIEQLRRERWRRLADEELQHFQGLAQTLRETTDKALVLTNWTDSGIGPAKVGSMAEWLVILASEPDYVEDLMGLATEIALDNLELYWQALGGTIDIFNIDGFDYGAQNRELFSPRLFEKFYVPAYKAQCDWIHGHTPWKVAKHCCGSIPHLIEPMIQAGIDILNPVQTSAAKMEARWLAETFGDRITFWGGGVDTQRILAFGTPEQVYRDVVERLTIFAPRGGFIWAPIHNIQYTVPAENIVAAFRAVHEYGTYPIDVQYGFGGAEDESPTPAKPYS